jgi:putative membrane protein
VRPGERLLAEQVAGARGGANPLHCRAMGIDRILQILVNAAALWVAVWIVGGLTFVGEWWQFLLVAVAFSLVNSYLRPILRILTFPISIVTLGLFLLVINALLLMLVGVISEQLDLGFSVADFWAALFGSIIISIVGWILSMVVGASRMPGRVL